MGLFGSKAKRNGITPVPTEMTDAWFDELIGATPMEAGLESSPANLAYVRDFIMVMVLDDATINAMVIDRDSTARAQYEQLIASSDSLADRMAFLNGWNPSYVPLMRDRLFRQRQKFLIDAAKEEGGYALRSRDEIRSELAEYRRVKPYG